MTKRTGTRKTYKTLSLAAAVALLATGISVTGATTSPGRADASSTAPMLNVDYRSLVSQADLFFTNPITNGNLGAPLGNGVMGSMVWTPTAQNLRMQINRSDIFGTNEGTNSSNLRVMAAANISMNVGGDVFLPGSTIQHVNYYDGLETIDANGVNATVFASKNKDVFALKITDNRATPQPITLDLSTPYPSLVTKSGSNVATSTLTTNPGGQIVLKQVTAETSDTGNPQNNHYNASAVAVDVSGRTATATSVNSRTLRLSVPAASGSYTILIGSAASMDSATDVQADVLANVSAAKAIGFDSLLSAHKTRWHDFWSKSFVYFPTVAGTGYKQDYALHWINFYYLMGSSQGGNYPGKFNGQVFNTNGGLPEWGPNFWFFNQTRSYYALETGNHPELLDPFLNMKSSNLPKYEIAAQQQWGATSGIYTEETESYAGPEVLPDTIAASLKNSLLNGLPYAQDVLDFKNSRAYVKNSRWSVKSKSGWVGGHHTHLVYNSADVANMFWNRYLYTGDTTWLEDRAYPFIKGSAEFYRTFPNLKVGADGKLHLHRTGFAETIWGGDDILNDLNFMRGVLKTAIAASTILGVDAALRPQWQAILDNLTPNPLSSEANALLPRPTSETKPTYALGRKPSLYVLQNRPSVWDDYQAELLNFDQVNLETHARGLDEAAWNYNLNTLETQEGYARFNAGTSLSEFGTSGASWARFLSNVAMMGKSDMVKKGLNSYLKFWQTGITKYPNRMPVEAQANGPSTQEDGVLSEGIQTALLQSNAPGAGSNQPVIHVFPAWPKDTEAAFSLAAKEGFTVTSSLRNQGVEFVELTSKLGAQAEVNNPWTDASGNYENVDVYRNGVKDPAALSGRLLTIDTNVGDVIVLVKAGDDPDDFRRTVSYASPINAWMTSSATAGSTTPVKFTTSGDLTGATTTYASSNPSVATVNSAGVVTGVVNGTTTITVTVTYANGKSSSSSVPFDVVDPGKTYLSDLNWTSQTSGWGTTQKDKGVSGVAMKINTTSYPKGLGTHANSTIVYNVPAGYSRFVSDVGVDEAVSTTASVVFKVIADGTEVFNSGTMTATSPVQHVDVDITGVTTLQLVVTDAGNGINSDHADWAGAALLQPKTYLSDLNWTSQTSGWGTTQKDKGVSGVAMKINTTSYPKGLGAHANSTIVYAVPAGYSRFISDVGVDEAVSTTASVVFKVIADGTEVFNSGTMTATSPVQHVDVDITGVTTLQLVVTDAGNGINSDHADWAGAALLR